jgi:hypothetical protein
MRRKRTIRVLHQHTHWKQIRELTFERRRKCWFFEDIMAMQSHAHCSIYGAEEVLDRIYQAFQTQFQWDVVLEPLMEQLRRNPDLMLRSRDKLVQTFLWAGIAGADFRWLENRCHVSVMAQADIMLCAETRRLWKMYIRCATERNALTWLPDVDDVSALIIF